MVPHRAPLGDWQLIFPTHTHTLREKPASGIYGLLAGSVQSFFSLLFTQRPAKKLPWNIDRRVPVDGDGADDYSELFF